jgi:hypothetical protein
MKELDKHNECWSCVSKKSVPGNAHIKCADPDPEMTGHPRGIENGWFYYPQLFDPVWKTKMCSNFKATNLNPRDR